MELVPRGEADPERAEDLEEEQAEGQVEWGARSPAQDLLENVCVPAVELQSPMRSDFRATS